MASSDERRMVFDLRGRRRHVVRVVYAVLAVLMGASLFLVVGPLNVGEILGGGNASSDASKIFSEQATRIERKLKKDPTDENLLLALTRARINAANALVEIDPTTQQRVIPLEARAEYEQSAEAWARYQKQAAPEPSPGLAQLISAAFFSLAETSPTVSEASEKVKQAARAQEIVAEARPTLNSLSTQAYYDYFASDFAAGDKAAAQAKAKTTSKAQTKELEAQLDEIRKRAKKFQKQVQKALKTNKVQGKESLENPFGLPGASAP
jgi:hypothetical protein